MKFRNSFRPALKKSSRNLTMELLDSRLMFTGSPYDLVTVDLTTGTTETQAYVANPLEGTTTQGGQPGKHIEEAALGFPEGFQPYEPPQESVFGNDDRDLINDPRISPYRQSGSMRMQLTNGNWSYCSGALVSPFVFMTAGHCVHDGGAGGSWFSNVQVTMARNGDERWYGAANATQLTSLTGWVNNNDPDFDFALIKLDRNIGNTTGWNGWWWYSNDNTYNGMNVSIAGYPSDLATQWNSATVQADTHQIEMYESTGNMLSPTSHQLRYNGTLDTFGGMSGSSVIEDKPGVGRVAVGVHAYGNGGDNTNEATRLREPLSDIISNVANGTAPTDRADLVDWDEWFDTDLAFMSDSSVRPGDSFSVTAYPRNNGTLTTGNYTVSFYASTNTFISSGDYLLGTANMGALSPFNWDTATINTFISDAIPEGTYNIGWIIDSGSDVSEFDESNNKGLIENSQLTISKALPDAWTGSVDGYAYSANQAGANTIDDSLSFNAFMNFNGEVESYYFAPEVSGSYTFRAFDVNGSSVNPSLAVYRADTGQKLAWGNDFIFSNDPFVLVDLNVWDRYIIAVADHEENSTGDVSIFVSSPASVPESVTPIDPANGDAAFSSVINVAEDTDYYRFTAPVDATSLDLTMTPAAALQGVLVLWDGDGNEIQRSDSSGSGGMESIGFNGIVPGAEYIASVFSADYATSGNYDLLIDFHIPVLGDFDGDEQFTCSDVDGLVNTIAAGTNDAAYDMNGDLLVNQDDLTDWLAAAGAANLPSGNPYLPGDANLDGNVNGQDFVVWNNNKFTAGGGWCAADFNADGVTNGQDFVIWNNNKFMSAIVAPPTEPQFDGMDTDMTDGLFANVDDERRTSRQVALSMHPSMTYGADNVEADDQTDVIDQLFADDREAGLAMTV